MINDKETKEKARINARIKAFGYEVAFCHHITDFFVATIHGNKNIMTGSLIIIMRELGYDFNSVSFRQRKLKSVFLSNYKKEVE